MKFLSFFIILLFPVTIVFANESGSDYSLISVFESDIYSSLFSNEEIREIFNDKSLVTNWLRVESAIAKSQAKLGIIPKSASTSLIEILDIKNIDLIKLGDQTRKVGRGIKGMLDQLRAKGNIDVKNYLHFGTTTQDIMDSATSMQIKQAIVVTKNNLRELILLLNKIAYENRSTIMLARSNGQDAIPTTFGLFMSTFIGELDRHYIRLEEVESRIYLQFGSTVGTLAPYKDKGLELQKLVSKELKLPIALTPWNPSRDSYVEVVQTVGLITSTLGRLGLDVNNLGRNQIGELSEGESGASSTMPHKRNPRASEFMVSFSYYGKMYACAAPDMMNHNDIRQGAPWILEWSIIPESFMISNTSIDRAMAMINKLKINKDQMLANFGSSNNFVMSEAVMNFLVEKVGRGKAYDMMKKAVKNAPADMSLTELLKSDKELSLLLNDDEIVVLTDPKNYLGSAVEQVEMIYKKINAKYK